MTTEDQKVHGYVTDRFPAVNSPADLARYGLTPDQISRFHADGFLTVIKMLDPEQVRELARRLELIRKGLDQHMGRLYEVEAAYLERPDEVTFHFLGAWLVDACFHDLIFSPQITVPISQLL